MNRRQIVRNVRGAHERALSCDELEHGGELTARGGIEPARGLVEQQHRRLEGDAARDQHSALLAARQLEELARGEGVHAESLQHGERSFALAGRRPSPRHVGAIDAGQHDVERGEVPTQAGVTVLQLVADEHDLVACTHGVRLFAGTEVIAASAALRRGPDRAGDQAEQRALAATVRADDAPVLAARELPTDVVQDRNTGEIDVDVCEA